MRTRVVAVVVAAGCARSAPETMSNATTERTQRAAEEATLFPPVSVPRPELDVEQLIPDLHVELRWPLTAMSHPELSPHFDVASVFAQPGIGWLELCERGVQNRMLAGRNRDELEYLRGWCSAARSDADMACSKLVPLIRSSVAGMADAVRIDIATIIANAGDIDQADHLIAKHRIDDVEILDTLAATYVELGMERDAYEVNRRAMDSTGHTTVAEVCRRLVRDLVLGGTSNRGKRLKEIGVIVTTAKVPDPTCESLLGEAKCWASPVSDCDAYFRSANIDPRNTFLLTAYRAWPEQGTAAGWVLVATNAINAYDLPGAKDLASLAVDAVFKTTATCDSALMAVLRAYTRNWQDARLTDELVRCHADP